MIPLAVRLAGPLDGSALLGALGDLVDTARRQRLEFKAIDTGIAAKQRQRDAELANSLPRLSAFGAADYADPNQRVFPQVDEFKFTWQIGWRDRSRCGCRCSTSFSNGMSWCA